MIVALSIILCIFCLYRKRSKYVFILTLLFFWVLLSFTYGNADENIYISRYTNQQLWEGNTEFLYGFLITTLNKLGFSYAAFKVVCSFIQVILIGTTINKYAKYPNYVLLLYFLFPLTIDIAQMRYALAASVMVFSLRYILDDIKNNNFNDKLSKNDIYYIIGILVATMIHTASLIWIVVLVAKKFNTKICIIFTAIFSALFQFIITPYTVTWIASKFGATGRISAYVSTAYQSTRELDFHNAIIRVVIYAIMILAICIYLLHIKHNKENQKWIIFVLKCNIVILCIIPILVNYTTEVYRMQQGLSILTYIGITNCITKIQRNKNNTTTVLNLQIEVLITLFAVGNLYTLILRRLFYTVYLPVFTNNSLIDFLFH